MLALITTLLAGFLVFLRSGLVVATASIFCAYAAFAAYAYFRSRMWRQRSPRGGSQDAQSRVPAIFAYIPYALLRP